jgi:hypothetical protein
MHRVFWWGNNFEDQEDGKMPLKPLGGIGRL